MDKKKFVKDVFTDLKTKEKQKDIKKKITNKKKIVIKKQICKYWQYGNCCTHKDNQDYRRPLHRRLKVLLSKRCSIEFCPFKSVNL